jgi:hypothetical protein
VLPGLRTIDLDTNTKPSCNKASPSR